MYALQEGNPMNNSHTALLTILLAVVWQATAVARDNDGANGIYQRMSAAYAALDSQAFADIYASDAIYLRSDDSPMLTGVDAIIGNFERFFASVRNEDGRLELRFRVIRRECDGTLCSDVGWYKLNRYDGDGALQGTSYGRFLTSPGRSGDGLWRFLADVDTGARESHWNAATEVDGLQFDD
jgi:uncharacterized protein (TIGR02246 family)